MKAFERLVAPVLCYGESRRGPRLKTLVGRSPGASRTGEDAIEGSGFGSLVRRCVRNPGSFLTLLVLTTLLIIAGCGGGEEEASAPPPPPSGATSGGTSISGAPGGSTVGGSTVKSATRAETLKDSPFTLNQQQPVPPDFRAAYQRKALIVVEFFKKGEDPFYPQGLKVDDMVNNDLNNLRSDYPEVEFFTYDIDKPGNAETSEDLDRGEYGTLAAQLKVGYTPFVAMLAPRGEGYVIKNLFQGYVERGVLDQALFDLTNTDVRGNSSDVDVILDRVELTQSGSGIEYFTLTNKGDRETDLSGFVLNVMDPESGDIRRGSRGVQINEGVRLAAREKASIGRRTQIVDADGKEVVGTFANGESFMVKSGDQVALFDGGGAIVDTVSL